MSRCLSQVIEDGDEDCIEAHAQAIMKAMHRSQDKLNLCGCISHTVLCGLISAYILSNATDDNNVDELIDQSYESIVDQIDGITEQMSNKPASELH